MYVGKVYVAIKFLLLIFTPLSALMINQQFVEYVRREILMPEVMKLWILCDMCEVWYHMACAKLN